LVLKPMGDSFTKPINSALLLTCEVAGADENANYSIKWLGTDNRQIVDSSGRSVTDNIHSANYDLSITTANRNTIGLLIHSLLTGMLTKYHSWDFQ